MTNKEDGKESTPQMANKVAELIHKMIPSQTVSTPVREPHAPHLPHGPGGGLSDAGDFDNVLRAVGQTRIERAN